MNNYTDEAQHIRIKNLPIIAMEILVIQRREGRDSQKNIRRVSSASKRLIPANLSIDGQICKSVHPTEKAVPLLEYLIKTYTNEGETVMDNTMGSGSTGVACVNTSRNFIGIELSEDYFILLSAILK